jgi:hypothetical protein
MDRCDVVGMLDYFEAVARREDVQLTFMLEPARRSSSTTAPCCTGARASTTIPIPRASVTCFGCGSCWPQSNRVLCIEFDALTPFSADRYNAVTGRPR